jgi:hypothetical protein
MGDMRNAYKILVGKPEGKRPLGRRRCRREDNTKIYVKEIVYENVDWLHLAVDLVQCRDVMSTVTNFRVP